jgi:hypothetical protein
MKAHIYDIIQRLMRTLGSFFIRNYLFSVKFIGSQLNGMVLLAENVKCIVWLRIGMSRLSTSENFFEY